MGSGAIVRVHPVRRVRARLRVPGDKSISHRLLLIGAVAEGVTRVTGLATGQDCASTRTCLEAAGVGIADTGDDASRGVSIAGVGLRGFRQPAGVLDAGNSGTTARLLMGLLAGCPLDVELTGDASLRRRPMRRVIEPLERMGASIRSDDGRLPARIAGRDLHGVSYEMPVASAQVKSAIVLAGLHAEGTTSVTEPAATRDHTEIALRQFGAEISRSGRTVSLRGRQRLSARSVHVPGDPSSAAFWAAAAAALPDSRIEIDGVGLNPTRTAFAGVLARIGASVTMQREDDGSGEPWGALRVSHGTVRPVEIAPAEVPGLIDELPVIAALATHGGGVTVRGAGELRVKESDRIAALVAGLRGLGAAAEELPDGFIVDGSRRLAGGTADAVGDHRLAMAFAIAALGGQESSTITGADAVGVSYPDFFATLQALEA